MDLSAEERLRKQFDYGPYPRIPLEKSPKTDYNNLFLHNLVTPYYLAYREVVDTTDKVILDAGCGSGYKSLLLAEANPGARIVGIDISSASVELAQKRLAYHEHKNCEFHILSIFDVASLGLNFDYINCDEALYFFDDTAAVLRAFREVLTPRGIIRSNLHSTYQRARFFRAQKLFKFLGLMDDNPEDIAIEIVIDIMEKLGGNIDLKQQTWSPQYVKGDDTAIQGLLANHLLQEDKGYEIPDLFRALEAAELEFVSMVNWRHWDVADLFQDPNDLPAYLGLGLATSSIEDRLRIYELIHPRHRLLDFWCRLPDQPAAKTLETWTEIDWQQATLTLHPQLCHDELKRTLTEAIRNQTVVRLSDVVNLPTLRLMTVDSFEAALLLKLINQPIEFVDLVAYWQQLRPTDWITGEPITAEVITAAAKAFVLKLEAFLYVLATC